MTDLISREAAIAPFLAPDLQQSARKAATDYLRGSGPWNDTEIGLLPEDDYLVQSFVSFGEQAIRQFLQDNFGWDIYEWNEGDLVFWLKKRLSVSSVP